MRRFAPVLVVAVLLSVGCGAVDRTTGSDASASRTASPPAVSPSPQALLLPGNCYGASTSPNATPTMTRGTHGMILTIPPGWSDQTGQVTGGRAVFLLVQAPATYGSDNASLTLVGLAGHWIGFSARTLAIEDAAGLASLGPQTSVSDCTLGGESASFYRYQDFAGDDVYRLLVLHCPLTRYPPLYAVEISSQGQIDDRAAADVRAILGSWNWGTNVCGLYN
jgi:hypothetical protein